MSAATKARWHDGEVARLRRHLAAAYEKHGEGKHCAAVAEVAKEFGVPAAQVREVIAIADRMERAAAATTSAASRQAHVDIYHDRRAPIIERLEKGLNPHAPWRDPREASADRVYRPDNTPWENTVGAACIWLRRNPTGQHDCSSDLLWCIVMQGRCDAEARNVAVALKHAWVDMYAGSSKLDIAKLIRSFSGLAKVETAASVLVAQCVTGIRANKKSPLQWNQWRMLQESGERMLWGLAETASRRAVNALR